MLISSAMLALLLVFVAVGMSFTTCEELKSFQEHLDPFNHDGRFDENSCRRLRNSEWFSRDAFLHNLFISSCCDRSCHNRAVVLCRCHNQLVPDSRHITSKLFAKSANCLTLISIICSTSIATSSRWSSWRRFPQWFAYCTFSFFRDSQFSLEFLKAASTAMCSSAFTQFTARSETNRNMTVTCNTAHLTMKCEIIFLKPKTCFYFCQ